MKYRILKTIGDALTVISLVVIFAGVCADLEHTSNDGWYIILMSMALAGLVAGLGRLMANFSYVEGVFVGAAVVSCAWIGNLLKTTSGVTHRCHEIKERLGSYSETFYECIETYEDYINSKNGVEVDDE